MWIAGLAVVTAAVWFIGKGLIAQKQQDLDAKYDEQNTVIIENAKLQEDVDYSKTPEYIIREAHKRDYITDDEELYHFDNDEPDSGN